MEYYLQGAYCLVREACEWNKSSENHVMCYSKGMDYILEE
jgi:hypothetical protein